MVAEMASAEECRWMIIYIIFLVPDDPSLPVLKYCGSASATANTQTGGQSRYATHLSGMQNMSGKAMYLYRQCRKALPQYRMAMLELCRFPSFDFRTATQGEIKQKREFIYFAETVGMVLFDTLRGQDLRKFFADPACLIDSCNRGVPIGNHQWHRETIPPPPPFYSLAGAQREFTLDELVTAILLCAGPPHRLFVEEVSFYLCRVVPVFAEQSATLMRPRCLRVKNVKVHCQSSTSAGLLELRDPAKVNTDVYEAMSKLLKSPGNAQIDAPRFRRDFIVEAMATALWPCLSGQIISFAIERRHGVKLSCDQVSRTMREREGKLFSTVPSTQFNTRCKLWGLADGWENASFTAMERRILATEDPRTLQELVIDTFEDIVERTGATLVSSGELNQRLRELSPNGDKLWVKFAGHNWKAWSRFEVVGHHTGLKQKILRLHANESWTPSPLEPQPCPKRPIVDLMVEAIRGSWGQGLSFNALQGAILRRHTCEWTPLHLRNPTNRQITSLRRRRC
ncbi:uncharacterized protein LOC62_01G001176 [Vanrija pseudolonga]|uniref:Uncharacterized protein n=1 Tax=Vanrija pseudolonga TaxID=143232 RepID=A0AAF1BFJ9_9TREE|nr:hypothetical protein LOC62_01G001176 [Vanrija pseudolonga]